MLPSHTGQLSGAQCTVCLGRGQDAGASSSAWCLPRNNTGGWAKASSLTLQRPFLGSLHRQKLQNSHQGNPDLASSFLVGGWNSTMVSKHNEPLGPGKRLVCNQKAHSLCLSPSLQLETGRHPGKFHPANHKPPLLCAGPSPRPRLCIISGHDVCNQPE